MSTEVVIGIIGGTGLDRDSSVLTDSTEVDVDTTPYGDPSDRRIVKGKISGVTVYIMGRHGKDHSVNPSDVNYRANIWTLKSLGVKILLVTTACGSLQLNCPPGSFAILDSYIDRTSGKRPNTLYTVSHISQLQPFHKRLQTILEASCKDHGYQVATGAVAVTIEGPRFSTLAESKLHKSWGASVVNMTTVPEAQLAAEAGLLYASLALVTDYDVWHDNESEHVSVELVTERMKSLGEKAKKVIESAVKRIKDIDWSSEIARKEQDAQAAIMCK